MYSNYSCYCFIYLVEANKLYKVLNKFITMPFHRLYKYVNLHLFIGIE